jgi:hypothetical protein
MRDFSGGNAGCRAGAYGSGEKIDGRLVADRTVVIDPEKIRAQVKFLSSDFLEGRGMGQRGGDLAAEYIATEFALEGLKPAGEKGTYFQKVPMVGVKTLPETTFALAASSGESISLKNLDDFVISNETQTESAEIDAPGSGVLLEVARAWAEMPGAARRTIFFAAVTAEEQGLLGSEYLGKHSPVPAGKVMLDLNYDALAPIGEPEEVEVSGAERTTFYAAVESVAFGLQIRADSHPEAGHYYRSDHFSLARVGIPSFSISEGMKYKVHDQAWGEEQAKDNLDHRYQQTSDEYKETGDFAGLAKMGMFGYELGTQAASQPELIGWVPGD